MLPLSLALAVVGALLLLTSILMRPAPTSPALPPSRPSPTWRAFPTRAHSPTPTSAVTPLLQALHHALLRGDHAAAQAAWEQARPLAPAGSAEYGPVMQAGARLALAQDDLEAAERRAWAALEAAPQAATWGLLGTVLMRQGESKAAAQALAVAQALDPALAPALFSDRWIAARRAGDTASMAMLAQTYTDQHPDAALGFYFRSAVLLAIGDTAGALDRLIPVLHAEPEAPAVLWFTLGKTYLARGAYTETLTALDVAGLRLARGDASLTLASDAPVQELGLLRAQAYLGLYTPRRCAEAEPLLRRWGAPAEAISRSLRCQTPTPTWTPWIPNLQKTPTPTPP